MDQRAKRKLELEGMSPVEVLEIYQKHFGKCTQPASPHLWQTIESILDKEFGSHDNTITVSDHCPRCKVITPRKMGTGLDSKNMRVAATECSICHTCIISDTGELGKVFQRRLDGQDRNDSPKNEN